MLCCVGVFRRDGRRGDKDADASLLASLDYAPNRLEIDSLMFGVRACPPADVVDTIGHDKYRRSALEDVALESFESPGRRVAAPTSILEMDLAVRKSE